MKTLFRTGGVFVCSCLLIAGLPAANSQNAKRGSAAVVVDGSPVSQDVFTYWLRNRAKVPIEELTAEQKNDMLEHIIALKVAAMAAQREGLDKQPEVKAQLELQQMGVLGQSYMNRYLEANPVSDADVKTEYDKQVAIMPKTEFKARHILVDSESDAQKVIAELNAGGNFEELAKSRSTGPSAGNGGDLGWFTPDRMVKPFADATAKLAKGKYTSSPVQTEYGWHVILLEDTRPVSAPQFEQVKQNIRGAMEQRKLEQLINKLRQDAKVEKNI